MVCAVVLRRLAPMGDARLTCSAGTSSSENMSRATSMQSGSELSWSFAILGSGCAVLLLHGVESEFEILDATPTGMEAPLKREYSLAVSSTNWVVVISLAEAWLNSSLSLLSGSCFLDR